MNQVSYTQRNCTDRKKIDSFLEQERTGVLGMVSEIYPYTVPVNYIWHNGSVYFHGMGSGKKEKILSQADVFLFCQPLLNVYFNTSRAKFETKSWRFLAYY